MDDHLRTMTDSDLDMVRAWRNHPSVRANMYTRHEISAEEHRQWWSRTRSSDSSMYLIFMDAGGSPQGVVAFTAIDRANGHASWAFYASPDAPRGVGSRMEMLALDHAFGQLKLHRLHCEVLAFNTAVNRLHQKFGFSVEGVLREHHLHEDRYVDVWRLAILDREWTDARDSVLARLARRRTRALSEQARPVE